MKIIALGHQKGMGKDECAKFMARHIRMTTRHLNVKVAGFADKLKETVYLLYAWTGIKPPQWYEEHPEQKEIYVPLLGMTMREKWIQYGEHCRLIDPKMFSNALLKATMCDILIIKDHRTPDEDEALEEVGNVTQVKVVNPRINPESNITDDYFLGKKWHRVLVNDGTLNDLNKKCIHLLEELKIV